MSKKKFGGMKKMYYLCTHFLSKLLYDGQKIELFITCLCCVCAESRKSFCRAKIFCYRARSRAPPPQVVVNQ
jgi:hypothetical protein